MTFSLIDEIGGAVPVAALTKDRLPPGSTGRRKGAQLAALDRLFGRCRQARSGAGREGALARVLVGLGEAGAVDRRPGPSPGCPRRCRRAAIRSMPSPPALTRPSSPSAGRSPLMPSPATTPSPAPRPHWSGRRRRSWPGRAAGERRVSGPRPRQHAGRISGPEELASESMHVAERPALAIGRLSATNSSPRTIRRSMPSAAPARGRRVWSTSSGASRQRPR